MRVYLRVYFLTFIQLFLLLFNLNAILAAIGAAFNKVKNPIHISSIGLLFKRRETIVSQRVRLNAVFRLSVYVFALSLLWCSETLAQSCANYAPVTRATGITYNSIAGLSPSYFTWRNTNLNQNDDNRSYPIPIGFDFWYLGVRYTQITGSLNGTLDFSTSTSDGNNGGTGPYGPNYNNLFSTANQTMLALAPLYADLWTANAGTTPIAASLAYQVSGSAPNRVLTVEWINFDEWNSPVNVPAASVNMQAKIYETTGVIEFIYGTMTAGASGGGSYPLRYTCGINNTWSVGAPNSTQLLSQQVANTTTFNNTPQNVLATLPTSNSKLTFTPPVPTVAPTELTFTAITQSGMTLNWTDNATNEVGYAVYNSTDNFNFNFVSQVTAGSTSATVTNLSSGITYYWNVYAVTDGALSSQLTGSQATLSAGTITSIANGNWYTAGTWDCGCIPTAGDNVIIADGTTVTLDVDGSCNSLIVGQGVSGSLIVGNDATARALNVGNDVIINSGGTIITGATAATHIMNVGGNLINNGTLDLAPTGTRVCNVTFNKNGNQTISGTGVTTNFNRITLNMGASNFNVLDVASSNFTATANFLTLTNGLFKLSTGAAVTPFTGNVTISSSGGIWLDNTAANLSTTGGTITLYGLLRATAGTMNIGSAANNNLTSYGGTITIDGGTVNIAGRLDRAGPRILTYFTMSSGTLTVATVGSTTAGAAPFRIDEVGSIFNMSGGTIIIRRPGAGNLGYVNTGGTVGIVSGGTLQIGDAFTPAAQTIQINSSIAVPNLVIGNGVAVTAQLVTNSLFVNNNVSINSGILNASGLNITLGGNWTNNGGTFTPGTGTVTLNGTANQILSGETIFYKLTVNNSSGVNLTNGVTVNGALTLTSGTLGVGTTTMVLNSTVSSAGGTISSAATGTVNYAQGSNGQNVVAGTYGNLTFSSFNKTLASSGTIGIAGTFTIGSATGHTITGSTIDFNGTGSQTIPTFNYNNLTSSSTGARVLASSSMIGIAATFTPGTNAYTITNSTIDFNGSGSQTISAFNYENLTISTNGTRIVALASSGTIGVSGTFSPTATATTYTITGSTVTFNGSGTSQNIPTFTFDNLTINNTNGITASSDLTVNGVLNLQSANPSSPTGSLDMGSSSILTMGSSATTIGQGDVTGIIKRTTINPLVTYTFGNEYTTAYFPNTGTLPTEMSAKISIGTAPTWRTGAIKREVEIIQTGGSGTKAEFSCHYLDAELNGNVENRLVLWVGLTPNLEYGRSAQNTTENWVSLSNINVGFFSSSFDGTKIIALDEYGTESTLTWNGSISDSWTSVENWTPNAGPSSDKNIIIPDASTTLNDPTLPAFTEIKTLTIDTAGILNSAVNARLIINGSYAWNNISGTFNPNTSNVIFTNAEATVSGTTNFYNVTIPDTVILSMTTNCIMRIAGTMTRNGTWRVVVGGPTTVEYNGGNQTVVVPNPATNYYPMLILSGSGTKTMPGTVLNIEENFSISGTATATAGAAMTIKGNFTLGSGTNFNASSYSHVVKGNFVDNGTFTPATSTMTLSGSSAQSVGGSKAPTFNNLTINNASGVNLGADMIVDSTLTFMSGNIVTDTHRVIISSTGSVSRTSGHVDGKLQKNVSTGSGVSRTFEIGTGSDFTPVNVAFANVSTAGDLTGSTIALDHPNISTSIINPSLSVNRYWPITNNGVVFTTYDATFNFVATDVDGGSIPGNFIVGKYDTSIWSSPFVGTRTSTSTQATGMTSFSDFALGEIVTYTISASADANGTITPSGAVEVNHGSNQAFTVTPSTVYHFDSLFVDGVHVDSTTSYTFVNVTANHTIAAKFAINTYTLTVTATNGTVVKNPDQPIYDHGTNVELSATPSTGYHFVDWTGDAAGSVNPVMVTMDANKTVTANFAIDRYMINSTAGANGDISPSGKIIVNHGGNQTFTLTPEVGYGVADLFVDGVHQDSIAGYTFYNVTANHTINVAFSINLYTINATASAGGTIVPNDTVTVPHGGSQQFIISSDLGYHFVDLFVDGIHSDSTISYTFENVVANHTIHAGFAINVYTIGATASPGGTITPAGDVQVNYGESKSFEFGPNAGYHFDSLFVDGTRIDSTTSYTFLNVTANHTIHAVFAINVYTITSSAESGGSINPSGEVKVNHGENKQYTFTPDIGYHKDSLIVDGVLVDSTTSYTFKNISANHTIRVTFAINDYTITASASTGGIIDPIGVVHVNYGESQQFTFGPNEGYIFDSLFVDGIHSDSSTSYTFYNITANHTIHAKFAINKFTITATAGAGGTINPSGAVLVDYGTNKTFIITPNTGYDVDSLIVDSNKVDSTTSHTFYNVIENHTISVKFIRKKLSITANAGPGGTVTPSGTVFVDHDGSQQFIVAPDIGYNIDSVFVDGAYVDSTVSYIFNNVTANHTIYAKFVIKKFTITATAGSHGNITPSGTVQVNYDDSVLFTMQPEVGYIVDSIFVDGSYASNDSVYTIEHVSADHTIHVTFTFTEGVADEISGIPKEYALYQNYPNPFNPTTTLQYSLPNESRVKLTIYNVLGQIVETLSDAIESAGYRSVEWNAGSFPSGIYFCKLESVSISDASKSFTQVKKMLLVK